VENSCPHRNHKINFKNVDVENFVEHHMGTMSEYITPDKVTSPRRSWTLIRVLESGEKPDSYGNRVAIALGKWEDQPALGMRWNGSKGSPIGTPQSRGLPTWFIIPKRLEEAVILTLSKDDQKMVRTLLEG
jgi:hypothetical protein